MKKILFLFILIVLCLVPLLAEEAVEIEESDEFLKEILISDIPVVYGDENFRERILERTKGERDPIGLVLTGGSARACAHIGVLKYLDEIGVKPDFIVSNSMGSIIGMLYAAGVSPSQIEEILSAGDISSWFSLTLPAKGGFLSSDGFKALVEYVIGKDYRLENTEIPVMVVCDDLVSKREVRITEGSFADVLIGSFALPAYFAPYKYEGHLLIDGGVISLAPIDAAYDYTDTVILSTTFYNADTVELINPVTILNTSFDIGKRQNASSELKKYTSLIWIRCDVEKFSFMAFGSAEEMAQIGYESAYSHSGELNGLYKAKEDIAENEDVSLRIEEVKKSMSYFNRIKTNSNAALLGINFLTLDSDFSPHYLKNSLTTGLEYKFLLSSFEISLIAGLGNNGQNLASSELFITFGAKVNWYLFSNVRFQAEAYADILRPNNSFLPMVTAREALDYYILYWDNFKLSLNQSLEYSRDYAVYPDEYGEGSIFSILVQADYSHRMFSVGGDVGYQLVGDAFLNRNPRNYVQVTASGEYNITHSLYLDASVRARFSVDGKGSVPVFIYDRFTSMTTHYGVRSLKTESSLMNLFINSSFGYNFASNPTFAETLIFEDSSVAVYFSSLFNLERGFGFSAGIELKSNLSLIGLIKLPVSLRVGYEYGKDLTRHVVASLVSTTSF